MELHPSDFGAILQRGIGLYARNFVRLTALAAATIVPVAIVQYVLLTREQPQLNATLDILQHPQNLRTEHAPSIFDSPAMLASVVASVLFGYYMLAFAFGAIAAATAARYRDEEISFRRSYDAALRRWTAILTIVGVAILALISAYLVTVVVAAIPIFAAAAFATRWFATIVSLAVVAIFVALAFALLCILITAACAICAVVVESCPTISALRLAVARILHRAELGRALLCAFTVAATGLIVSTVVDTGTFLAFPHVPGAYEAVDAAERIVLVPLLTVILVVYYFDVRLRYEGFDLDERVLAARGDEPTYAPTAYLTGEERALVKRFLERRYSLTAQSRRTIAARLAAPARSRVPPELQQLDDESLLERL